MTDITAPTSEEIRAWREERGLTQEKAARVLGVSHRTVQSWESGETTPPAYLRAALLTIGVTE